MKLSDKKRKVKKKFLTIGTIFFLLLLTGVIRGISKKFSQRVGEKGEKEQKNQKLDSPISNPFSALKNSEKEKVEFTVFLNVNFLPPYSLDIGRYWNFQMVGNFAYLEENWFSINRHHQIFENRLIHHGTNYNYVLSIYKKDRDKLKFEENDFVELREVANWSTVR